MILVVSMNPALDVRMVVGHLSKGRLNRIRSSESSAGGKGVHVASTALALGSDVVMTGFLPVKGSEDYLDDLSEQGIDSDFIKVEGRLRTCISLLEEEGHIETELLEPGCFVYPNNFEILNARVKELVSANDVVVFSGSLPLGLPSSAYAQLIVTCNELGCQTILDTSGKALEKGIAASPSMIKPNRQEAEELVHFQITDIETAFRASRQLSDKVPLVVISLDREGAVVTCSRRTRLAAAPVVEVCNPTGSGDCLVGGFAFGLERRLPLDQTIKLGVACGVANAASYTTGEINISLVRELEQKIVIHDDNSAAAFSR